ncbi:ABC-type transporter Mla subunit MlaD [Actinoplanes lutulentus]|uniref:Uncharacterized protein n=1 Tax=Actinoplanes lutulentus TaxID=1287878 RepID=A0A327ZJT9_9ACTN|nr:hypothetical protein [Actinoplanes lutulentus]MBB2944522.1 ABC-type transporter Mla subunit MlaD [Actinoplanes lutulentus]RAK42246.1 hypothetical protein B0I29_10271 [Actinoplanes lutulentus]
MAFYGDPDELDRLAAELRGKAARIRNDAAEHEARGHTARWVSDAAAAYRQQLSRDRAETERRAGEIEHAAALLAAHADEVRETLAAIARIEKQITDWVSDQRRSLMGTIDSAADKVTGAVDKVTGAVDQVADTAGGALRRVVDWADDLPEPGDVRWLEVGRLMNRQGAL